MGEMTQNIAVVETCHSDLRNHHLQESGESGEDPEFVLVKTEASRGGEITTLHDTRWNENFRVLLVDDFQTGRSLQIAWELTSDGKTCNEGREAYCR